MSTENPAELGEKLFHNIYYFYRNDKSTILTRTRSQWALMVSCGRGGLSRVCSIDCVFPYMDIFFSTVDLHPETVYEFTMVDASIGPN